MAVLIFALVPLLYVLEGFVVSTLFNWFIASLVGFTINIPQGIGISLLATCLTYQTPVTTHLSKTEKLEHDFTVFGNSLVMSLLLLLVGAITHSLM